MILTESRSLAGVLRDIASEYQCSVSLQPTDRLVDFFALTLPRNSGRTHVCFISVIKTCAAVKFNKNTQSVLEREVGPLKWERLALTETQVKDYKLPIIMKLDKRFKPARLAPAVETEAISQRVLTEILRDRLEELLPGTSGGRSGTRNT